jgi:hypothetical protein
MLTVSASRNVLVKLLQNAPKPGFSFIITINEYFPKSQSLPRNGEVIGGENLRPAMVNI